MDKLAPEQVTVLLHVHLAAMYALFATHPQPDLLRAAFGKTADGVLSELEGSPVLYGLFSSTVESLHRSIGQKT